MNARELGFDEGRLERLVSTIEADVGAERYDGVVVLVARRGQNVLHEAVGFAERSSGRRARTDDVFCLFSVTKTFTAAAVLARVDRVLFPVPDRDHVDDFRPPLPQLHESFGDPEMSLASHLTPTSSSLPIVSGSLAFRAVAPWSPILYANSAVCCSPAAPRDPILLVNAGSGKSLGDCPDFRAAKMGLSPFRIRK